MNLDNVFGIAGTALNAQTVRMNTTASNLANACSVARTDKDAVRAKRTTFKTIMEKQVGSNDTNNKGGVKVAAITDDPKTSSRMSDPGNPLADKEGYVFHSNVNEMSEMVEMMAASRSYQNNVEVVNTTRQLMMLTIDIIKN